MSELGNYIIEGVQPLIDNAIGEISYDETINARIVAQDVDDASKYLVNTGTLKFYAYNKNSDKQYKENDSVQILIPQGNYELEKTIIGYHSTDTETTKYSSDKFNDMIVGAVNSAQEIPQLYNPGYEYFGVEFNFSPEITEINNHFNIKFTFSGPSVTPVIFTFTNEDFVGNLKVIDHNFKQKKLFLLPENFNIINYPLLTFNVTSGMELNNIKNITYYFGYKKETILANPYRLFAGAPYYKNSLQDNSNLYAEVYDFDTETLFTPYKDIVPEDSLRLNFWLLKYTSGYLTDGISNGKDWYSVVGNGWEEIYSQLNSQEFPLTNPDSGRKYLDSNALDTRFQFLVGRDINGEYTLFNSNILILNNANIPEEPPLLDDKGDLILTLEEGNNGVYKFYGMDGHILSEYWRNKTHTVTLVGFSDGSQLLESDQIEWIYPIINTGISVKENSNTSQLAYNVKEKCYQSWTNNTITCRVTRKEKGQTKIYTGSITLEFGGAGNIGSEYSLNIDIVGDKKYIEPNGNIVLKATLERKDGQPLGVIPEFTWGYYLNNNYTCTGDNITIPYSEFSKTNGVIKLICNYTIGTLKSKQNIIEYLPIPTYFGGNTYTDPYMTGASRIVYGMTGEVSYDDTPYCFYDGDIAYQNYEYVTVSEDVYGNPQHKFINNEDNLKVLQPCSYALIGNAPFIKYIVIRDNQSNEIWEQPILTLHNSWELTQLNNWNGEDVEVTEEGVFSPLICAGTKDYTTSNLFTGTVLGSINNKFGLYGYQSGQYKYWLTEKGEFFVGDGDNCYIKFNDQYSANLDIKTKNFILDAENIKITQEGYLYLSDGITNKFSFDKQENDWYLSIEGNIIANSGKIGKFNLDKDYGLYYASYMLYPDPSTNPLGTVDWAYGLGTPYGASVLEQENILFYRYSTGISYEFPQTLNELDFYIDFKGFHINKHLFFNYNDTFALINNHELKPLVSDSSAEGWDTTLTLGNYIQDDDTYSKYKCQTPYIEIGEFETSNTKSIILDVSMTNNSDCYLGLYGRMRIIVLKGDYIALNGELSQSYTASSIATTSDINLKNSISQLNSNYEDFYYLLNPIIYKYNDGSSDRYHTGLIAQWVKESLDKANLTTQDFAGLIIQNQGQENEKWSLRYEEFISLNIWQIQKLKAHSLEQDKLIQELQQEIKELKNNYETY